MAEIALNIDPSIWNVLKFLILSVVATPLLELLLDHLLSTKATYDVLRGHHISMSDSRLGVFSLHSTYWGPRRNKIFLLLLGLIIIAAELLFEFSFSVTAVDIAATERVYIPPPHPSRYNGSGTMYLSSQNSTEPSQFLEHTAGVCIDGPSFMLRSRSNHPDVLYSNEEGLQYSMNGTYTIRKPYLAMDNTSVFCSITKKTAWASFTVPRVINIRHRASTEGFDGSRNSSGFHSVSAAFSRGAFQKLGLLQLHFFLTFASANDDIVCLKPRAFGFFCAMMPDDTFTLLNVSLFESSHPPPEFTMAVVLQASGEAVHGLRDRDRRIRLLASLAGVRLMSAHLGGSQIGQRLVSRDELELISMMTLVAANEEGVGGIQDTLGTRIVRKGERQSATVKDFAMLPIFILLGLAVLFIFVDIAFCVLIDKISNKPGLQTAPGIWKRLSSQLRVKTSKQWLRARIAHDLNVSGANTIAHADHVAVKIVPGEGEQLLQMLPGTATPRLSSQPLTGCRPELYRGKLLQR